MISSTIARWWWGGDPDQIIPKTGLSLRDNYLIQRSWRPIYNKAGSNGVFIFIRLFRKNPITKPFFKTIKDLDEDEIMSSIQFKAHAINLMTAINTAILNLHEPDVAIALLNKLGDSHRFRKIQEEHFEDFFHVLVSVLIKDLHFNEAEMKSWNRFIDFMRQHIYEKLNVR